MTNFRHKNSPINLTEAAFEKWASSRQNDYRYVKSDFTTLDLLHYERGHTESKVNLVQQLDSIVSLSA